MKRAWHVCWAALTLLATTTSAHAQAFDKLPEGALAYVSARPSVVIGILQKLGVEQLPAIQRLRKQLGGIDPFNPILLAAPGIDIDAPLVAAIYENVPGVGTHSRVVTQLRDEATFRTFVMGVIASGQLPMTAATGVKDAVAQGSLTPGATFVLRIVGHEALLDEVEVDERAENKKKAATAAEIARRFPLAPARRVVVAKGARRLLSADAAAVLYVDARKLDPLFARMDADDIKNALAAASGHADRARTRENVCAQWRHAPAVFDDVALAVDAKPDGLTATWAWGTQSGSPLRGLKLTAVDDAIVDAPALAKAGEGMFALYSASLTPFGALKHPGVYATLDSLSQAIDGCDTDAGVLLLLRSWPLALGALATSTPPPGSPFAMYKQVLASLRNVVIGLRSLDDKGMHGAVAASFDAAARASFEPLLALFGGGNGVAAHVGTHAPTIYSMKLPDSARPPLVIGLESATTGHFALAVADSQDALEWAYKAGDGPAHTPTAHPPLARVAADATLLSRIGQQLSAPADRQALLDMLARLRRVDGTLDAEGDTLRLTLRAPLKL